MDHTGLAPVCRRCGRPAVRGRANYAMFEGMHFVCFHYEFEHRDTDPDDSCGVAGCPCAPAERGKEKLLDTPRTLVAEWSDGPPANWDVHSLPGYLEALTRWLEDADGYYAARKLAIPWDSRTVVGTALRAATVYE
ncbi:hypothetical protein FHU38_001380 [Saccharomonospora amisosensis]|uniref:DUF7660 domain-containing protein n=1 Tax=Saccharomonospora amisosensis TaxID=1128677 RepID=A0A7X5ZQ14_9PSEU|nr:hypothetical protein [Saccharomonospora amisosensis]NIJ11036.1 hypothetical protein [Saccharomonospora amisosensis]